MTGKRTTNRPVGGGGARNPRSLANLRSGSPPPEGNQRALSHGAYAKIAVARLESKVAEVFAALGDDAPLRGPDGCLPAHDAVQVRLLAECLCRLDDVGLSIREYGVRDQATKGIRPAVELESKLRREAADYLDALGMTPRSRAKLGLDLTRTIDAATAMSHPDPAERERLMRQAGLLDEGEPDE